MDDRRFVAYSKLTVALLQCPAGEEMTLLQEQPDLIDTGLVTTMLSMAQQMEKVGEELGGYPVANANATWLRQFARQLAKLLAAESLSSNVSQYAFACVAEVILNILENWKDAEKIYAFWQKNEAWFDEEFLLALPVYFDKFISEHKPDIVAEEFCEFGNLIQQFPLGTRWLNLEMAIVAYQQALTVFTREVFPETWAETQNNLAIVYRNRIQGERAENLERAIAAYQQALEVHTREAFPNRWANIQNNLGSAYLYRLRDERAENLERAIAAYQRALEIHTREAFPNRWANIQNNLGEAFRIRIQGERTENWEQAIAAYQRALEIHTREAFPNRWANIQNNLGNAYSNRIRGDRAENLERAIAAYQAVLQVHTREAFPQEWATTQNNLGATYFYQTRGDRAENLERAIAAYQQALGIRTRKAFPEQWAETQSNLAGAYLQRIRRKRAENIELSIAAYQRALTIYTREAFPERWAMAQSNLAVVYWERIRGERTDNIKQSIVAFQQALDIYTHEAFPHECRNTSGGLGNLQTALQNWPEAVSAYEQALLAAETLYRSSLLLDSQAAELKETADLPRRAAYAYAKTGQLETAVLTIDRGRARGLSDRLQRDRADLSQLQQSHPDLYNEYADIANQLRNLESIQRDRHLSDDRHALTPEAHRTTAQRLNQRLTETLDRIRQVPGYDSFLQPPTFDDIKPSLRPDNPLVYLIVTPSGSLALIVTPDAIDPLWLDEFTETTLVDLLNDTWLAAYNEYQADPKSRQKLCNWCDAIELVTEQLWAPLMSPLVDRLQPHYTRATLVPTGYLSLLPLHAAWTETATGRHYALDDLCFTYAPNAQSLATCQAIAQRLPTPDSILAIDNPRGDLQHSKREIEAAIATFDKSKILPYKNATVAAVSEAIGDAAIVHFSCHGSANFNEPLTSGLRMHDGHLTLQNLFDLKLSDIRLALLSACDTGIPGLELADEAIGLPVGLLQVGVAGVVASLWPVDDLATMLLLSRFYHLWRNEQLEPAEALRQAQIWLRDTNPREEGKKFKETDHEIYFRLVTVGSTFDHPVYWSAFGYTGV